VRNIAQLRDRRDEASDNQRVIGVTLSKQILEDDEQATLNDFHLLAVLQLYSIREEKDESFDDERLFVSESESLHASGGTEQDAAELFADCLDQVECEPVVRCVTAELLVERSVSRHQPRLAY